jgi:hypothetical protein
VWLSGRVHASLCKALSLIPSKKTNNYKNRNSLTVFLWPRKYLSFIYSSSSNTDAECLVSFRHARNALKALYLLLLFLTTAWQCSCYGWILNLPKGQCVKGLVLSPRHYRKLVGPSGKKLEVRALGSMSLKGMLALSSLASQPWSEQTPCTHTVTVLCSAL